VESETVERDRWGKAAWERVRERKTSMKGFKKHFWFFIS
jgi:hypothetical protein